MQTYLFLGAICIAISMLPHHADARMREARSCGGAITKVDGDPQLHVTADEATCDWPFTVPALTLACNSSKGTAAITAMTEEGISFALSDEASNLPNAQPLDAILKDDPNSDDGKADDDTWADIGLSLCR